jgi:hypothetical protein
MERSQGVRVNVNLRLDDALRQQLIAEAKQSMRSLNSEIAFRLRNSIEAQRHDDGKRAARGPAA